MVHPSTGARYLDYQYDDSAKLRIRAETHRRFTVGEEDFAATELRHLRLASGQAVLDAGCGPGRLRGSDVVLVGSDRSFGMLREAVLAADHARFAQADIVALPFAEATFDRVAALGVLYHVRDWRVAVRELRRVCRPGGRLVISTTGRQTMQRLVDVHFAAAREVGYVPLLPTVETLRLEYFDAVREVLPSVECHVLDSALEFPAVAPALRFYTTNRIDLIENRPPDGSYRSNVQMAPARRMRSTRLSTTRKR